jgi:hypothetical protein
VDGVNLFALLAAGVAEGEFCDARGSFLGDDLERLDDARDDFVLQADIFALSVFADDDEVDARVTGVKAGEIFDGAEVGVELELLPQRDVDGGKAAANRRGDRPLECDGGAFDGLVEFVGDVGAAGGEGVRADGVAFPRELAAGLFAGGFKDADDGLGNFRADAVAGDEGDGVSLDRALRGG